ncbi:MAG TPA: nuclear transport factor 2 family protein [Streptomyces sp.]
MPTYGDELIALPADSTIRRFVDRAEVSELIDRYIIGFDTLTDEPRDDDWYRDLFTDDLVLTFPMIGAHHGLAGVTDFQRAAKRKWARTHHVTSNHLVSVYDDHATAQGRLLATHVHPGDSPQDHFTIGGRVHASAVRTPAGWRLRELTFELVWYGGDVPSGPGSTD